MEQWSGFVGTLSQWKSEEGSNSKLISQHSPCSFFSVSQNFCSSVKYLSKMNTFESPSVAIIHFRPKYWHLVERETTTRRKVRILRNRWSRSTNRINPTVPCNSHFLLHSSLLELQLHCTFSLRANFHNTISLISLLDFDLSLAFVLVFISLHKLQQCRWNK